MTTLHDVEPHRGFERFDKTLARHLHLRYSDGFIVQCDAEQQKLQQFAIEQPDFVIPHGDYEFFTDYRTEGVETEDMILFFGNIAPYKGLTYLLQAAPQIEREHPDAEIVVAGRGDMDRYSDLLDKVSNVQVRNEFIPKPDVAALFQRAKVVVLPYVEATQSGIIPIAYAFKKPVVASRTGCIPDVVDHGETGYLVPPQNVEALAEAINQLLADEQRIREMGEQAYAKMQTDLSWDTIADQTIEAYQTLLTKNKSNSTGF